MRAIVGFLWLSIFVCSCSQTDYEGYTKSETGLHYKLHYLGDGDREPKEGDVVVARVVIKTMGDTILYDTKWKHNDGLASFDYHPSEGINECFSHLRAGDSASFIINTSYEEIAEYLTMAGLSFSKVRLDIVPYYVFTKTAHKQWKEDMFWLHDKEMNEQIALKKYVDSLGLTDRNYINGIYYQEIKRGLGDSPKMGDALFVRYKAYFLDGKIFDSTYDMEKPFAFNLGDPDQVLDGFETGIQFMKKSGKAKFIIPSQLAFGSKGSSTGIVPPFTTLVYEVELINIM